MRISRREMLLRLRATRETRALWWTVGIVLASLAHGWHILIAGLWPVWLELLRWGFPVLRDLA